MVIKGHASSEHTHPQYEARIAAMEEQIQQLTLPMRVGPATRSSTYYRNDINLTRLQEIDGKGVGLVAEMEIPCGVVVLTMAKPIVFASIGAARKFLCSTHRPLKELFKQCVRDNEPEIFNDLCIQIGYGPHACWIVDDSFDFSQLHPFPRWYYLNSACHKVPMQQGISSSECNLKPKAVNHSFFGKTVDFIATRDLELGEELQWAYETGVGGDLAAAQLEDMKALDISD